MRVWHDPERALVFIDGSAAAYFPQSLIAVASGDDVSIVLADGSLTIARRPWPEYQSSTGGAFANVEQLMAYLSVQFAAGITLAAVEQTALATAENSVTRDRHNPIPLIEALLNPGL